MTGHNELAAQPFGVPWHATQLGELCMLTVGDPQHWTGNAITLTNSNKGSYRRLSIVGDRLVSYLSLGPTQPDSLAIKRIIDEGLSIRDVKEALLKGDFDARKYFSQQQSRAAIDMVTSGKLPVINWTQWPTPLAHPSPTTHSVLNAYSPRNTDALPPPLTVGNAMGMGPRQTEPLNGPMPTPLNLWSYSDKVPAFITRRPPSQALWFQKDRNCQFVMQEEQ